MAMSREGVKGFAVVGYLRNQSPNQSLEPTRLSRAFLRFELPLGRLGLRLASLRQPPGGSAPAVILLNFRLQSVTD
jgi:hypothetical protein